LNRRGKGKENGANEKGLFNSKPAQGTRQNCSAIKPIEGCSTENTVEKVGTAGGSKEMGLDF